jgi:hypothetical protein
VAAAPFTHLETMLDAGTTHAGVEELPASHDAVLASGDASDDPLGCPTQVRHRLS